VLSATTEIIFGYAKELHKIFGLTQFKANSEMEGSLTQTSGYVRSWPIAGGFWLD